jgi:hypothetical protein
MLLSRPMPPPRDENRDWIAKITIKKSYPAHKVALLERLYSCPRPYHLNERSTKDQSRVINVLHRHTSPVRSAGNSPKPNSMS